METELTTPKVVDPVASASILGLPSAAYTFRSIPQEYKDCEKWPAATVPTAAEVLEWFPHLSSKEAEERAMGISDRFERLQRGIKVYLGSGSLKKALAEAKCTKEVFYRQFNRCLLPNPFSGEGIVGWAGLISQLRLKTYTRVNEGSGTAGQFQKWIRENRIWRELLHRMILTGNGGKKWAARKPDVRSVARNYIAAFKREIALGQYPHDGRSNARRAIERYITDFVAMHNEATAVWFGDDVASRQHLGTGPQSFNLATGPFDVLGSDAHTTDCIGFIILNGPSGPQKVPVTRIQLVVNLCHHKRLVTGYSVCIRKQIESSHVEEAYLMGNTCWKPKKLTIEGLSYADGAGFPNGVVEGLTEINPALVRLDNAAQHYANNIRVRLRHSLGCAIVWGAVGHWWRNAITERFFGTLERYGFQRMPSTMGSGPQDPHRPANPVVEARGKGIEWDELIQLVDVLLANYNAKPHKSLGGISPLDSLRSTIASRSGFWIARPRPPHTANSPRIGVDMVRKRIAGSVRRRIPPYVEIGEVRYTAECLSSRYDLIGRHVYIHLPWKDIRTVECFLDSGLFIGELRCMDRGWSMSPHSLQTRQVINALIDNGEMWVPEGGDPLVTYIEHLEKKAVASATENRKTMVSGDASAAADILRTIDAAAAVRPVADNAANDGNVPRPRPKYIGVVLPRCWE